MKTAFTFALPASWRRCTCGLRIWWRCQRPSHSGRAGLHCRHRWRQQDNG